MSSKHKGGEGGQAEGDNPEPFLKSARRLSNDNGKLVSFRVKLRTDGAEDKEHLLPASSLGSRDAFRRALAYRGVYVTDKDLGKQDWLQTVAEAVNRGME